MQKLDFTQNIKSLRKQLRSDIIIKFINDLPVTGAVDIRPLTPIIVESKSNYDQISKDDPKMEILNAIEAFTTYSEKSIGELINNTVNVTLQGQTKVNLFMQSNILGFYNMHYTLIKTSDLCDKVLFQNKISEISQEDTIIFCIISGNELEIAKYTKILNLLNDLIVIIQKVSSDVEILPLVTLLDSGSDTNLGIKTTAEITQSLFQIFKEVWDWVLNRRFYKSKLRNAALLDNLNVMLLIKEAQEKGAIDVDTARIYRETIIRRTEDLLELNVLPKSLIEAKNENNSKKILSEFSEMKMLESGSKQE